MFVFDNYYSVSELAKTAYSMALTKVVYPKATLVRRPFIMRGKPRFVYGEGFTTGYNCRIETFGGKEDLEPKLIVGKNFRIGDNVHIAAAERIEVGDDCLLASKIFITDLSHGDYGNGAEATDPSTPPNDRPLTSSPVKIGNNVWIGESVSILGGVTIGDGCIIGANSVVSKSIPDNSIAVGCPARVIKRYDNTTKSWVKA